MAQEIDAKLTNYKPEEIRDDEGIKKIVQDEAEKLLDRVNQYI